MVVLGLDTVDFLVHGSQGPNGDFVLVEFVHFSLLMMFFFPGLPPKAPFYDAHPVIVTALLLWMKMPFVCVLVSHLHVLGSGSALWQ